MLKRIEFLRESTARYRGEVRQLCHIARDSPSPTVREWAQLDVDRLEGRIQILVDELARLEAEEPEFR